MSTCLPANTMLVTGGTEAEKHAFILADPSNEIRAGVTPYLMACGTVGREPPSGTLRGVLSAEAVSLICCE